MSAKPLSVPRAEFLGKMFGPELIHAFREFKTIRNPALTRDGLALEIRCADVSRYLVR
ncbi:MAG TPA: hypothetical protein VL975_00720 [Candidatus Micrarchaeia archaeon]|nr:hypothetical protein [Candidatus Micrarchaeia archaeon]